MSHCHNQLAPVLFIGHGSPENVVLDNDFSRALRQTGQRLAKPRAILAVSAHWLTPGVRLTTAPAPEQVFDFYGFPDTLYQVRYPARTDSSVVADVLALGAGIPVVADADAGFDHGTWTVLKHLFPDADVPVLQLSLDRHLDRAQHYRLAQRLRGVRELGVMVVASGNVVHNLGRLDWHNRNGGADWALDFDRQIKQALLQRDVDFLTQPRTAMALAARLAVPSEDHYWPLLYSEGLRDDSDELTWIYEGYEYGSIALRSYLLQERQS